MLDEGRRRRRRRQEMKDRENGRSLTAVKDCFYSPLYSSNWSQHPQLLFQNFIEMFFVPLIPLYPKFVTLLFFEICGFLCFWMSSFNAFNTKIHTFSCPWNHCSPFSVRLPCTPLICMVLPLHLHFSQDFIPHIPSNVNLSIFYKCNKSHSSKIIVF